MGKPPPVASVGESIERAWALMVPNLIAHWLVAHPKSLDRLREVSKMSFYSLGVDRRRVANPFRRELTILATLVVAVWCFGCTQDIAGSNVKLPVVADTSLLTPEVAKSLSPSGTFPLIGPEPNSRELTEAQARAVARSWIRQFFPAVRGYLEAQRGAVIDQAKLHDCDRIYYGQSPYKEIQDVSDGGIAHRVFGPWWLVPLCVGSEQQVFLGVAAYATDIAVKNDQITFPKVAGGEFVWRGISPGTKVPMTPEEAANMVATATGSKVASVPTLLLPNFRQGSPAAARWQVTMSPVPVVSSRGKGLAPTPVLYMGPSGPGQFHSVLQRAAPNQPSQTPFAKAGNVSSAQGVSLLTRKPSTPVLFEPAEVQHE